MTNPINPINRKARVQAPIKRVNFLYTDCLKLIEQEIKHITHLAIVEKLSSYVAKDLVAYTKLLGEMKKAQEAIAAERAARKAAKKGAVTTEELEKALKGS